MESAASPLEATHYYCDETFQLERARIERRYWIFATFDALLAKPDSYVTRRLGGIPVVIQNFNGTLKAFENVCAHRQMALQWERVGQRALVCRYHGWSYDASGKARIPQQTEQYRFEPRERDKARIREFALARVGAFVFVNLSETPLELEEQFEPALLDSLRGVSEHFDTEVIHTSIEAAYNWKLGFENVIDPNHVPHLHANSFARIIPRTAAASPSASRSPTLRDLSWHQASHFSLKAADWHTRIVPYGIEPLYHNWFLYPNVNFVSVGGYSFTLQQFNPLSADRSEILLMLFVARKRESLEFSPAVLWHNIQAEKRVLDEDIDALERLQAGLHAGTRPALLGAHESRLAALLRWHAGLLQ